MIGAGNATHGQSGTALHEIWLNMRKRCQCESDPAYARYGGRGIKVCRRWNDFQLFAADVGERPSPSHTIDRRDNDGDYEPGNCRWATYEEQNNNRRDNRWITFRGETRTVGAWANVIGMNQGTLHGRLRSEWPIEQALTSPVRERRHG